MSEQVSTMFISADHLLNVEGLPDAFPVSPSTSKAQERQQPATRGLVTPAALVVFGVIANVLFWGGLLTPFNANASPEIAYLHSFITALGLALAIGGFMATMMIVAREVSVPLLSREFAAGCLHMFVLTATGALVISALLHGM